MVLAKSISASDTSPPNWANHDYALFATNPFLRVRPTFAFAIPLAKNPALLGYTSVVLASLSARPPNSAAGGCTGLVDFSAGNFCGFRNRGGFRLAGNTGDGDEAKSGRGHKNCFPDAHDLFPFRLRCCLFRSAARTICGASGHRSDDDHFAKRYSLSTQPRNIFSKSTGKI